jgi:molybdopterin synthase catalytic subunit
LTARRLAIRLHARAAELAGTAEAFVEAPDGTCCADVKRELARAHPALAGLLPSCALASDTEFLPDSLPIRDVPRLHLIPPVSGG